MKIRQTIFLLPLFLLAGCASAGGSQSRDLDLKELCTEEQVFQYADFEWGTDSEQLFKQSFLKFGVKSQNLFFTACLAFKILLFVSLKTVKMK